MQRANSLEKTLMLGKIEDKKRRGQQRMRRLDSITDSIDMNLSKSRRQLKTGECGVLKSVESQRVRHDLVSEQQQHPQPSTYTKKMILSVFTKGTCKTTAFKDRGAQGLFLPFSLLF